MLASAMVYHGLIWIISIATILWLIALRRENVKISGWQFFKVGVVAMPLAMLASILLLLK